MISVGADIPAAAVELDGTTVPIADLARSPLLLVFEKESCPTCVLAMPIFSQWSRFSPDVEVLAVSQDDKDATERFFASAGIDMRVAYDHEPYTASEAFGLTSVPSVVLIDDGKVIWAGEGWHREKVDELGGLLADLAGRTFTLDGVDDLPPWKPG